MIAAVFPGQGSQKPGMGKELFDAFPEARGVFAEVASATDMKVEWICFEAPEDTLRQTQNAQLALFTTSVAAWRALQAEREAKAQAMAGHSVGEYAALVCSGALALSDGARLVKTRGYLMAEAGESHPGTMAAVLGLEREQLEEVCEEANGVVVIANDNCPGQLVISGDVASVARAGEMAGAKGAKRVLPLNVSGAFHSPLMQGPSEKLAEALGGIEFSAESIPVYANVTAEPMT